MATQYRNAYRPMTSADIKNIVDWFKAINWLYWLQRAPMALLSIPAAYGVAAFAEVHLPAPFNWLAGLGFESVYLGCVALADQMFDEDDYTTALWWTLNIIAVVMSALVNTLFFSGNTFAGITPESIVHGVPLPALSFGYSLLLHKVTNKNVVRDFKKAEVAAAKLAEKEQYEKENPFLCECGRRFADNRRRASHRRSCAEYQATIKEQ